MKVEMIKALPYGLWCLMTNTQRAGMTGHSSVYDFVSWNLSLFDWRDPGKCTFWMVETTENILIGHQAKLLRHRTRCNKTPHSVPYRGPKHYFFIQTLVCEAGLNSRLIIKSLCPLFFPMEIIPFLMTKSTREKKKINDHLWKKGSIKSTSLPKNRVLYLK